MNEIELSWYSLGFSALLMAIPALILYYYRTGLIKSMAGGYFRMAVQLTLVGIYLNYIFDLNHWYINFGWVFLMIIAATLTIIRRSELSYGYFFVPIATAILINAIINGLVFGFLIIGSENFVNARYVIPIMGMVIGNTLSSSIIGIRSFYNTLRKEEHRYRYYLMCGASRGESLFQFTGEALKDAFAPIIGSNASIGLIWLPGMMTGQILGGSDPINAIKYQITIVFAIFAGSVITVFVTLLLSRRYAIDDNDVFRREIFRTKRKNK